MPCILPDGVSEIRIVAQDGDHSKNPTWKYALYTWEYLNSLPQQLGLQGAIETPQGPTPSWIEWCMMRRGLRAGHSWYTWKSFVSWNSVKQASVWCEHQTRDITIGCVWKQFVYLQNLRACNGNIMIQQWIWGMPSGVSSMAWKIPYEWRFSVREFHPMCRLCLPVPSPEIPQTLNHPFGSHDNDIENIWHSLTFYNLCDILFVYPYVYPTGIEFRYMYPSVLSMSLCINIDIGINIGIYNSRFHMSLCIPVKIMTTYAFFHRLVDDQMEVQLQPREKKSRPKKKAQALARWCPSSYVCWFIFPLIIDIR